ncbi:MAG: DUF930 domain-containing protein [Burkholderiales bacterium]|nr:MAG: DUF930 domain-containing protein [Burkholderiales bacterium]
MNREIRSVLAVVAAALALIPQAAAAQSALSKAQEAVIAKKIARTSATEKQMVAGWSDGKKLAEFFCSEAGLKEIAKQHKGADRLALGPDDEGVKRFKVEGNRRVSGDATVRIGPNWKELSFDCVLDPAKAVVTSFTYAMK